MKRKDNSRKRHLVKTITWRIIGTIDTMTLAWIITGNPSAALKIGASEVFTKMVLYYLHERVWFKVKFGSETTGKNTQKRHLLKTISWRIVGTIDTMTLAWIITGNPLTGFKIGMAEVFTKMFLYYLHERAWYKLDYGLTNRKKNVE